MKISLNSQANDLSMQVTSISQVFINKTQPLAPQTDFAWEFLFAAKQGHVENALRGH